MILTKLEEKDPSLTALARHVGCTILLIPEWGGYILLPLNRLLTSTEACDPAEALKHIEEIIAAREQPGWGTAYKRACRVIEELRLHGEKSYLHRHTATSSQACTTFNHPSGDTGKLTSKLGSFTASFTASVSLMDHSVISETQSSLEQCLAGLTEECRRTFETPEPNAASIPPKGHQVELCIGTDGGSPFLVGTGDIVLSIGQQRYPLCQDGRLLPGDTAERLIKLLSPEAIACIKTLLNAPASQAPDSSDLPSECPPELRIVVKWLLSHGYETVFAGYAMKQPYVNIRLSDSVHKQRMELQDLVTTISFDFGHIDLIPPSNFMPHNYYTISFFPSHDWLIDLEKTFHSKPS